MDREVTRRSYRENREERMRRMNAGIKERRRRKEADCEETRIWLEVEDPERWRRIEANHIAAAPVIMSTWVSKSR
jgi:hypothetical protein